VGRRFHLLALGVRAVILGAAKVFVSEQDDLKVPAFVERPNEVERVAALADLPEGACC